MKIIFLFIIALIFLGCSRKTIPTSQEKIVYVDRLTVDTSLHTIPGRTLYFENKVDCPDMVVKGMSDKMQTTVSIESGKMKVETKTNGDTIPVYTPKRETVSENKAKEVKIVTKTPRVMYYLIIIAFVLGVLTRFIRIRIVTVD